MTLVCSGCLDKSLKVSSTEALGQPDVSDSSTAELLEDELRADVPTRPADTVEVTTTDLVAPLDLEVIGDLGDASEGTDGGFLDGALSCDAAVCGDGYCSGDCGENKSSCSQDCCLYDDCGDGKCKGVGICPETEETCPSDCGR